MVGQSLSSRGRQSEGMKNRLLSLTNSRSEKLIATFGKARLVGLADGSMELRGGHQQDQTAAKEWISLFMHEAVPRFAK
jgi:hypothetical protein